MKRWAIGRISEYEVGSRDWSFGQYPGVNFRYWGTPTAIWGVGQIATNNLTQFDADADCYVLPDATLDSAWSSLPANVRNQVKNKVEAAGLAFSVNNNWTVREVLHYLVHQIQPGINIEAGDVRDVE